MFAVGFAAAYGVMAIVKVIELTETWLCENQETRIFLIFCKL
jgi:hypothetical protein